MRPRMSPSNSVTVRNRTRSSALEELQDSKSSGGRPRASRAGPAMAAAQSPRTRVTRAQIGALCPPARSPLKLGSGSSPWLDRGTEISHGTTSLDQVPSGSLETPQQ